MNQTPDRANTATSKRPYWWIFETQTRAISRAIDFAQVKIIDIPDYRLGQGLSGSTCSGKGTGPRFPGSGGLSGGPGRGVGGDGVGCGRGGGCGLLWSLMYWWILRWKIEALDRQFVDHFVRKSSL
jgi:hypothetical protein